MGISGVAWARGGGDIRVAGKGGEDRVAKVVAWIDVLIAFQGEAGTAETLTKGRLRAS